MVGGPICQPFCQDVRRALGVDESPCGYFLHSFTLMKLPVEVFGVGTLSYVGSMGQLHKSHCIIAIYHNSDQEITPVLHSGSALKNQEKKLIPDQS